MTGQTTSKATSKVPNKRTAPALVCELWWGEYDKRKKKQDDNKPLEDFGVQEQVRIIKNHAALNWALKRCLNYQFRDQTLLAQALTHSSFIHENPTSGVQSNEKLEFLGDAVLGSIISDFLFKMGPALNEGQLSKWRGNLVNRTSLAHLGNFLKLHHLVFMGRGEIKTRGMFRDGTMANSFEAILGAIYLDSSYKTTKLCLQFLFDFYHKSTGRDLISIKNAQFFDVKGQLQEWTMSHDLGLPHYDIEDIGGKHFEATLTISGKTIGKAKGVSKKEACQKVAYALLQGDNLNKLLGAIRANH